MPIPKYFCWTKFGTEAGEPIDRILQRKEDERKANGGIFLWGIGNALGPSFSQLLELVSEPEVIFSPIRSTPKKQDVTPEQVVVWTAGETLDGYHYDLPPFSIVTSRASLHYKKAHYALVCESQDNLNINSQSESFEFGQLKNLRTGKAIGYSQVTSVVMRDESQQTNTPQYLAAMQVKLVYPYFVKLTGPVIIPNGANAKDIIRSSSCKPQIQNFPHQQLAIFEPFYLKRKAI